MSSSIKYDWPQKHLSELTLNELSDLEYILSHLPLDVEIKIKAEDGKEYGKYIGDYVYWRTKQFFSTTKEDYEKIVGKCFSNSDNTIVVKVVSLRDDYDNPYYESSGYMHEFLYEKYEKYKDETWHIQDYIWLQDTAKGKFANSKYLRWCLTSQTDMNVGSEHMFHLGKDGNLYVDMTCGGDYNIYTPFSSATFELIREEAIKNDGEYEVIEE